MIDAYFTTLGSGWWALGYIITLGIMIGLHEPNPKDSFGTRFLGATFAFIVAYFVYPVFLGMFLTRFVK